MQQYLFEFTIPFLDRVIRIPGYGGVVLLVYLFSVAYMIIAGRKQGIDRFTAWLLVTELFAVGLLGAILWDYIWTPVYGLLGLGLAPIGGDQGLAWMGAVIGTVAFGVWYIRFLKLDLLKVLDLGAPLLLIGYAIGRFACLLGGCCYGRPTSLPWGIVYPEGLPHYCAPAGVSLHPTPIYASLGGLIALGVLVMVRKRLVKPGQVFLVALGLHSLFRIIEEAFRFDHDPLLLSLTVTQLVSVGLVIAVAALLIFSKRFGLRNQAAAPATKAQPEHVEH
jgi:phosphatidylglycerol:prolipoprotein diacylglycerol transferase